jgi:hypothetical protein
MDLEDVSTAREGPGTWLCPGREPRPRQILSSEQAYQAAYRFIAKYYDYERTAPILRLLESFSATGDDPDADTEARAMWRACVQETVDAVPVPRLPPPWDS